MVKSVNIPEEGASVEEADLEKLLNMPPVVSPSPPPVSTSLYTTISTMDPRAQMALVLLISQNTLLVVSMKYSLKQGNVTAEYLPSTVVFCIEVLKLLMCLVALNVFSPSNSNQLVWYKSLHYEVTKDTKNFLKMGIPCVLYVVCNNLIFLAVKHLPAAM